MGCSRLRAPRSCIPAVYDVPASHALTISGSSGTWGGQRVARRVGGARRQGRVRHAACGMRHAACGMRHAACGMWSATHPAKEGHAKGGGHGLRTAARTREDVGVGEVLEELGASLAQQCQARLAHVATLRGVRIA